MKFNWGTGIFLFYTLFASTLFFQVYQSTKYDNHLVVEHYYEKDIQYQSHYEKVSNSLGLEEKVKIQLQEDQEVLLVQFPENLGEIKGNILFYRASNKKEDKAFPLLLNETLQMQLLTKKFAQGYWIVEVDWEADGKYFFDTKTIYLGKDSRLLSKN